MRAPSCWLRRARARIHILVLSLFSTMGVTALHAAGGSASADPAIIAVPLPAGHVLRMSGRLDDPAWQLAPVHEAFWQTKPVDGLVAPVLTRVRVLYDQKALYFGIEAHDPESERIRAPQVRRDKVIEDQDHVSVLIDAVGAGRSALVLRVNAAGVLADGIYTAATHRLDFAPDFDIDAQVQRDAQGYRVELRVPLSALRFDPDSARAWRVQVLRSYPREAHREMASVALPMAAGSLIERMNPLQGFNASGPQSQWSLRPTLTWHQQRATVGSASAQRESSWRAGLDFSWRPAGNWVFDATWKPDFSQVELDVPQLSSNAQFPLQLPEKRRFFLESSDLLEMPSLMSEQGGGGLLPVYTRSISQPAWGLRASYRDDEQDAILLQTRDQGGALMLLPGSYQAGLVRQPASSLGLLRYRRQLGASSAGLLLIDRRYEQGRGGNAVLGGDWVWRSEQADRVRAMAMFSQTDAAFDASAEPDGGLRRGPAQRGGHLLLDWLRKSDRWEPSLSVQATTEGYRNDTGFTAQSGFRQLTAQLQRKNRLEGEWTEINPYLFLQNSVDLRGRLIRHQFAPGVWLHGPHDLQIILELHPRQKQRGRLDGRLHVLDQSYVELRASPSERLNLVLLRWTQGGFVDLAADQRRPGSAWLLEGHARLGSGIELEARSEWTLLRQAGQRQLLDRVDSLLLVYHHSARDSLRLIVQRRHSQRWATEAAPALPAAFEDQGLDLSLTATRRLTARSVLYLGLGRQRAQPPLGPKTGQSEAFAKWQFEL